MNLELMGALNELEKERGISREVLLKAIADAIESAFRKSPHPHENIRVDVDDKTGRVRVFARKAVVEQVADPANEISLAEALRINPRFEVDDVVEVELTIPDLGRIAAQTAKQVVVQRIREAERSRIYDEYRSREGDILTGVIRRIEHRNVFVDLGRAEAVIPPSEQVPTERYAPGVRMKFYLEQVNKTAKGPQLILSRSHPGLLRRLFELEVPEIHDGTVEIRAWAREPGHRSKIAVWSTDRNVDPVGACVGPRGARVQQVVKELRQEKVDVVAWDPDPEVFLANALSPARALKVYLDPTDHSARVIVSEKDLSPAIGKEGQNARLAARLTGWRIDIKSESQWNEVQQEFEARRQQWMEQKPAAEAARQAAAPVVPAAVPAPSPQVRQEPVAAEAVTAPEAVAEMVPAEAPGKAPDVVEGQPGVRPEVEPEAGPVRPAEEEERVKSPAGKVRRLKGARKVERRHIEEELEETELPTLFTADQQHRAAEESAAPEPEPAARLAGKTNQTLSVPLLAVAKRLKVASGEVAPETENPPPPRTEKQGEPPPAKAQPHPAAARPVEPPPATARGESPVTEGRRAVAPPATPASTPPAAPPAAPGPVVTRPGRQGAPQGEKPRGKPVEAEQQAAEEAERPKRVLKSLAELSPEDFGFAHRPKRRER